MTKLLTQSRATTDPARAGRSSSCQIQEIVYNDGYSVPLNFSPSVNAYHNYVKGWQHAGDRVVVAEGRVARRSSGAIALDCRCRAPIRPLRLAVAAADRMHVSSIHRRPLLQMVPVSSALSLVSFFAIHLVPGDPIQIMLHGRATPETVAKLHAELGLDRPLW